MYGDLIPSYFPNDELKKLQVQPQSNRFKWGWTNDSDLIKLYLAKKSLPELTDLFISYMPYARADRDENGGSNCFLRHIGELIQSLNFESITVLDPHSDLTLAYLGSKSKNYYPLYYPIFLPKP